VVTALAIIFIGPLSNGNCAEAYNQDTIKVEAVEWESASPVQSILFESGVWNESIVLKVWNYFFVLQQRSLSKMTKWVTYFSLKN
jgi:hypothetical protein